MSRLLASIALPREGLALFRRGLALLCLLDAGQRLTQATLLYSDRGVLPRYAYYAYLDTAHSWSLYLLSGQPIFATGLLLLTVGLAAWQLLGRERRAHRFLLWVLVLSVQQRHPGLVDSADDLLRLLLFWDVFLPDGKGQGDQLSLGTLGLQLQLSLAVLATSLHATPAHWAMAAQWGEAAQAMGLSWLGLAPLIALPAIWFGPSRQVLLPLVGLLLGAQAVLLDPTFPLTLAVGLACLWRRPGRAVQIGLGEALTAPRRHKVWLLAWTLVCLLTSWAVLAGSQLSAPAVLGLQQDWSRVYPLSRELRSELILRPAGYPQPLYKLDLQQGRRLRLLSQALLQDPRLVSPLVVCLAVRGQVDVPIAIWQKTDRLSSEGLLPLAQVRQLGALTVQRGRAVPVRPL